MADQFDLDPVPVDIYIVPSVEEWEQNHDCGYWKTVDGWLFEIDDCPYHFAVTESWTEPFCYVATNLETGARASKSYERPRDAAWYTEQNWKQHRDEWTRFIEANKRIRCGNILEAE